MYPSSEFDIIQPATIAEDRESRSFEKEFGRLKALLVILGEVVANWYRNTGEIQGEEKLDRKGRVNERVVDAKHTPGTGNVLACVVELNQFREKSVQEPDNCISFPRPEVDVASQLERVQAALKRPRRSLLIS